MLELHTYETEKQFDELNRIRESQRAALRHAVVCVNVTGRSRTESKQACVRADHVVCFPLYHSLLLINSGADSYPIYSSSSAGHFPVCLFLLDISYTAARVLLHLLNWTRFMFVFSCKAFRLP